MARRKADGDEGEHEPEQEQEGVLPVATEEKESVTPVRPEETTPLDLDDYEGSYKQLATGEIFGLKKVPDDPHGRTYHLKNAEHFWAGTAEEFRKSFEKE